MARVSEEYYKLKKAAIVDAALKLCVKKTVSSITMQDVIDAADLSQGAIYRYYKSIDLILADLLSRIRTEQYGTVDRLNDFLYSEIMQVRELRTLPATEENIALRRKCLAKGIKHLYNAWAADMQKFLSPHKKIELGFKIFADVFPDRAEVIFEKAVPEKRIDAGILDGLACEISDGVIAPRVSIDEFLEYNTAAFEGIRERAVISNAAPGRDADESSYDIKKRFEAFARSSMFLLGLEEYYDEV